MTGCSQCAGGHVKHHLGPAGARRPNKRGERKKTKMGERERERGVKWMVFTPLRGLKEEAFPPHTGLD